MEEDAGEADRGEAGAIKNWMTLFLSQGGFYNMVTPAGQVTRAVLVSRGIANTPACGNPWPFSPFLFLVMLHEDSL